MGKEDRAKFSHPNRHSRKSTKSPVNYITVYQTDKGKENMRKQSIQDIEKEIQTNVDNKVPPEEWSISNMISKIQKDFHSSFTEIPMDQQIIVEFLELHKEPMLGWDFEKDTCFKRAFDHLRVILAYFLENNLFFQLLSTSDKKTLMGKNLDLVSQYVLSQYFSASTGVEQINLILNSEVPVMSKFNQYALDTYNTAAHLMNSFQAKLKWKN